MSIPLLQIWNIYCRISFYTVSIKKLWRSSTVRHRLTMKGNFELKTSANLWLCGILFSHLETKVPIEVDATISRPVKDIMKMLQCLLEYWNVMFDLCYPHLCNANFMLSIVFSLCQLAGFASVLSTCWFMLQLQYDTKVHR